MGAPQCNYPQNTPFILLRISRKPPKVLFPRSTYPKEGGGGWGAKCIRGGAKGAATTFFVFAEKKCAKGGCAREIIRAFVNAPGVQHQFAGRRVACANRMRSFAVCAHEQILMEICEIAFVRAAKTHQGNRDSWKRKFFFLVFFVLSRLKA